MSPAFGGCASGAIGAGHLCSKRGADVRQHFRAGTDGHRGMKYAEPHLHADPEKAAPREIAFGNSDAGTGTKLT